MTEPVTRTVEVPGAVITYDVRPAAQAGAAPTLLLIGSPMDASGFATLAGHFTDRTVVTYDPRGTGRSKRDDAGECSPDDHADDLAEVIAAVDGPVDIFASSGGAVNALALAARHPARVRTVVAHEPPACQALPDRDAALAATAAVRRTYQQRGWGAAMAHFIALTSVQGPVPADFADRPGPDPAQFGMPADDDGSRDDVMFAQNLIPCTHYQPDFDALRSTPVRLVIAVGEESTGQLAYRAGVAVAERLGLEPVAVPGDHAGFLGGEFGQTGKPVEFAAALRRVLA